MLAAKITVTKNEARQTYITKIQGAASEKPFAVIETEQPFTATAIRLICTELGVMKVIIDGPVAPEPFQAMNFFERNFF